MAEEEKNFASFGTPLEPFEEDDVPKKKPIRLEDQIVTDEKGRRRFHGAFTGGFSAGYFNSVGSERGWTPSTFISSRSTRTVYADQCPEDYMDSEDVGAFGIAPRKIHTTKNFTAPEHTANKRKRATPLKNETLIPGDYPLKELVIPLNNSIGVKLLCQMGWRQGEGIGPKVKRKKEKKKTSEDAGAKVYGCAMPPTSDDESDSEMSKFAFAPKDVEIVQYIPKENVFGLGYEGLDKRPVLSSSFSLFTNIPGQPVTKKRVGMQGQAFGVGAFEDDDDDIYAMEDMSNYNFILDSGPSKEKKLTPKETTKQPSKILAGFQMATKPPSNKKHFPLPSLPKNFKPFHVCVPVSAAVISPATAGGKGLDRHKLNSFERGATLGEEIQPGSVFNFISPHDKARLDSIRASIQKGAPLVKTDDEKDMSVIEKPEEPEKQLSKDGNIAKLLSCQPRASTNQFKPFAGDQDKQNRYENFLAVGSKQHLSGVKATDLTEWEKVREAEEFQKASQLYRPLAASIASRFVAGKSLEHEDEGGLTKRVEPAAEEDPKEVELVKVVEPKSYGRLTHTRVTWYPDKILCRRFNVPNPFPDSSIVGVPKAKREKFSIFNFLTAENTPNDPIPIVGGLAPRTVVESGNTNLKDSATTDVTPVEEIRSDASESNDSDAPIKSDERPPMDLFKAIFQDSDEGQSSETEDENDDVSVVKAPEVANLNPIENARLSISDPQPQEQPSLTDDGKVVGVKSNELQKSSITTDIVTVEETQTTVTEEELYGPKLPPKLLDTSDRHVDPVPSKKPKMKRKHKHKKHKKQKRRCKRKHTEKSSDESDSESSADETNPKLILHRLKKLQKSAALLL